MNFDVVVLGGGIIGVSVAIHLQKRGRAVALIDLKSPGSETSFGNAGLIQREGVYPYAFPRDLATLLKFASNRSPLVHYHLKSLPKLAPFLWKYWFNSQPQRHAEIARTYSTLIQHSLAEHHQLAEAASAMHFFRKEGWLQLLRTAKIHDQELAFAEKCRAEYGTQFEVLDAKALQRLEPHLNPSLLGALHFTESQSLSDPGGLVAAYAKYFEQLGGRFFFGDASTLAGKWTVMTKEGQIKADSAVISLGPWSDVLSTRLGYRFPLAVKRGYHMHYAKESEASLTHPVLDFENGFLLTSMAAGIRLTTGAEFARRDSKMTPVQLDSVEPIARELFPLRKRLENLPWLGSRPCTPDMMPIISQAPRHPDLWLAFGHAHHGLTLGPITGRLLAEMITGEEPITNPAPFSAQRF